jgi:hypothetical protein
MWVTGAPADRPDPADVPDQSPPPAAAEQAASERAASLRAVFAASPRPSRPQEIRSQGTAPSPTDAAFRAPGNPSSQPPGTAKFYDALPVPESAAPRDEQDAKKRHRRRFWLIPVVAGALTVGAVAGGIAVKVEKEAETARTEQNAPEPRPTTPGLAGPPVAAVPQESAIASASQAAPPSATASSPVSASPPATASGASPGTTARLNPAGTNLALCKTATTSSIESDSWPASDAVDGDMSSRWSSGWKDPQWIKVDLGAVWAISDVRLAWEHAYAVSYRVDISLDARSWTTVYRTTAGTDGPRDIHLSATPARYVRMYGTKRSSQYGYSLQEFEIR